MCVTFDVGLQPVFDLLEGLGGFNFPPLVEDDPTLLTENFWSGGSFSTPSPVPASQFANYLCCFNEFVLPLLHSTVVF